jgi:hypothetical protein
MAAHPDLAAMFDGLRFASIAQYAQSQASS